MTAKETLTPRTAALLLGVRLDSIYALIWAGKLEADKKDGRWEIPLSAVEARSSLRHISATGRASDTEIELSIPAAIRDGRRRSNK
jgi:excisionase family DNA binding protein